MVHGDMLKCQAKEDREPVAEIRGVARPGLSLADVDDIGRQRASALMRARPSFRLCACKSVFGPPEDRCRDRVNQLDQILGRLAREKDGQPHSRWLEAAVIEELPNGHSH